MTTNVKNITLWVVITIVFVLFSPAVAWVERQTMFEVVDALAVGGALGAAVRWGPAAWKALKPPVHSLIPADFLVVGLGFICIGGAARFGGQWYWRASDKPNWWIDSVPLLYFTIIVVIGLFLVMATTYSEKGAVSIGAFRRTIFLVCASITVAVVLVWAGWG
jgi:hypothetical protein